MFIGVSRIKIIDLLVFNRYKKEENDCIYNNINFDDYNYFRDKTKRTYAK